MALIEVVSCGNSRLKQLTKPTIGEITVVLIDVVSSAGITSYLFNEEENLYKSAITAIKNHFNECKAVGKVSKITRL